MLSFFKTTFVALSTFVSLTFAQDVTLTKNGYYRVWVGLRLPLGKYNKMFNYTIEQAVDAFNLNEASKKAYEKLMDNHSAKNHKT